MKMKTRLPQIPQGAIYAPPVAPPPPPPPLPVIGEGRDFEAVTVPMAWPRVLAGNNVTIGTELSVYQTRRRWRACDVYIAIKDPRSEEEELEGFPWILSCFVYALGQSGRTLVASGRLPSREGIHTSDNALVRVQPRWIVAARSVAERYEVTIHVAQAEAPGDPRGTPWLIPEVTIVASDEAVEPPPSVGEMAFGWLAPLDTGTLKDRVTFGEPDGAAYELVAPPHLELRRVHGINGSAAPRYLQIHGETIVDFQAYASDPNNKAVLEWPLGPGAGYGHVDGALRYRTREPNSTKQWGLWGPTLVVSTTSGKYTAPPDPEPEADPLDSCYLVVR